MEDAAVWPWERLVPTGATTAGATAVPGFCVKWSRMCIVTQSLPTVESYVTSG
jgi:hypothetical protein